MTQMFFLLAFCTSLFAAELPEAPRFKNHQFTISRTHYYALMDGRIWSRTKTPEGRPTSDWSLFLGTGLPENPKQKDFVPPRNIREIEVDGDVLVAIDDQNRIYKYDLITFRLQWTWQDKWGEPWSTAFFLPPGLKAWSVGRQNWDTLYHEDLDGNRFHFGKTGITSLYTLSENGQEIGFADTGLPADFSRQICGPERGTFVAENLSASGATVFVISKTGEVFTKMEDFDINGAVPFYRYHYDARPKNSKLDGVSPASNVGPRRLPLADWLKQPAIPTGARGRITRNITILSTGQGNGARELRVQGEGPDGFAGYYTKQIYDTEWKFIPTGEPIQDLDVIPNTPEVLQRGPSRNRAYRGTFRGMPVEIPDFNLHCSPSTLLIHPTRDRTIELVLHFVDSWTPFQEADPEHDPLSLGKYKVTLEVPEETRRSTDPVISKIVRETFLPLHHQTFAMAAVADTRLIEIVGKNGLGPIQIFSGLENPTYFEDTAQLPEYLLDETAEPSRTEIVSVIQKNLELLNRFEGIRSDLNTQKLFFKRLKNILPFVQDTETLINLLGASKLFFQEQVFHHIWDHSWAITTAQSMARKIINERSREDFDSAKEQIIRRLCGYFTRYAATQGLTLAELREFKSSQIERYPFLKDYRGTLMECR